MALLRSILLSVLAAAVALARPGPAPEDRVGAATRRIEERIVRSGAEVGVAFRTLDGHASWYWHADQSFHAASTMKIPVLIELFRQEREGRLRLDDQLEIRNEFHSLVDGSVFRLDPQDDSEAGLYQAAGQKRTLGELAELMITRSSNLATDLLVEKLGTENIRGAVVELHADGMHFLRGVEDAKAYEKGLNNTTTARGLEVLLAALAGGQAVDRGRSRRMVEILERQKFNEGIPAGLPEGLRVAHKTGELAGLHHDAAIVYAERPFVLVILVSGIAEKSESARLMAAIAREFYEATSAAAR